MIPMTVQVYERGASGVPGTTPVFLPSPMQRYTHTITATGGFESCQAVYVVAAATALDWLTNGLMRACVVYSPDAEVAWEGYLTQIDATFGQEQRSVSLDTMANRVRVKYATVLGTPGTTSSASDTASQTLYGIKDLVLSVGDSDLTEAGYLRDAELARRKNPRMRPLTNAATGDIGGVQLTLNFAGWYTAFDWLITSNTSTTKTSTTTQVGTLTTAYVAVNNFFSTDYGEIDASGITATEFIEADTTYREKIEKLFSLGNGSSPYAWGIYEGRQWEAGVWAGASPTTIHYQRVLGEGKLFDAYGSVVQPWNVRPDKMFQTVDLLDPGPVATAQDAAARFYVQRVTCAIDESSIGVTLEPEDPQDLSAIIVRKY